MPKKEEIDEIIKWCEERKKERKTIYIIERNPFRERFPWAWRYIFIEIDKPKEMANPRSLVYDSTLKTLWHNVNGMWKRLEADEG